MVNFHATHAQDVGQQLEELESRFETLLEKIEQESSGSKSRTELTHLYSCLKQEVKAESHRLSLLTVDRELTEVQRDFLVPTLRQAANALATSAARAPVFWLPDLRDALAEIQAAIMRLEVTFPEPPNVSVDRLQRELIQYCRTRFRSRTKLLDALRRANCREETERLGRLFAELYDESGLPVSSDCEGRQTDVIRERVGLKELLNKLTGEATFQRHGDPPQRGPDHR